ncbi:cytochrome b [Microlunatus flavus]|uniref:Cytochrome bc1 complex cytochrome b subunit n=1 Tax=Microlunatus flavus TaxID=1036181 RepID=A0A1H9KH44_9ACTN|nr:cytochrome b N-terminal domain-containing protein [Microlunatus flavus]SEQ98247.1 ubiquinol-cytochrome c reductase cytochrome b subunit [Microlunatus flavus]
MPTAEREPDPPDPTRSGRLLAWLAEGNPLGRRASALARTLHHRAQPTTWALLWGTVSAGCFVVLLVTGLLLLPAYDPSGEVVTYAGGYAPLHGLAVSRAFASTVHLSLDVPGGLLVRQTHHWAALVLPASLVLQLTGAFFTGAFRRPRRAAWVLLVATFVVVLGAGWSGYGLPDDDLSGTGLRIVEGTTLALPFVGTWLTFALFGGEYPGRVVEHLYVVHLLAPAALVVLVALRLRLVLRAGPVQLPGAGRDADRVVGLPAWPQAAARVLGLGFITAGVLTLMGATMTISPVWRYGPASPADAYAGSQPDWYTAFLDGALRLVPPGWELSVAGRTWTLAVLVPLAAIGTFFAVLLAWPLLEERLGGDRGEHQVLDRPRDRPARTGVGAAGATFYGTLWLAGSADLLATQLHLSFEGVVVALRVVLLAGPVLAFAVARTACRTLRAYEEERERDGAESGVLEQSPDGGFTERHVPVPSARAPRTLTAAGPPEPIAAGDGP